MPDKDNKEKESAKALKAKKPEKKKRRSLLRVMRDTINEGKKVIWPSRKQWFNLTVVVTVFVVIMTAVIALIDLGLTNLLRLFI